MKYKKLKVDYKTPLGKQLKELNIVTYLDLSQITDLLPSSDYIYDVEDGTEMLGKSVNDATKELKKSNRRPLTVYEGLALFRKNKKILENHYIDLGGSRCKSDCAPYLCLYGGGPKLSCYYLAYSRDKWGSASCSSIGNSELGVRNLGVLNRLDALEKFKSRVEGMLKL